MRLELRFFSTFCLFIYYLFVYYLTGFLDFVFVKDFISFDYSELLGANFS